MLINSHVFQREVVFERGQCLLFGNAWAQIHCDYCSYSYHQMVPSEQKPE